MPFRWALVALVAAVWPLIATQTASAETPQLDRDKPFQCLVDGNGKQWRVQCAPDDAPPEQRVCLYAPDSERDLDGKWIGSLERARTCWSSGPFDIDALKARGFKMVEAIADAPYGWHRDERGRVMQVVFDLHRRLYFGASWAPQLRTPDALDLDTTREQRFAIDFGVFEWTMFTGGHGKTKVRHRVSLVEGNVTIAPFGARVVAFHYDASLRYRTPLLRITTFFGEPRRHDARFNLGFWAEAGDLEIYSTPAGDDKLWRFATFHLTADLWQSRDLYSFLRIRGGGGLERAFTAGGGERGAFTPGAALDLDLTLDRQGRKHVVAEAVYEVPIYFDTYSGVGDRAKRFKAEAGLEWVVVALNDQPLAVRVAGGTGWRDDIPGADPQWAYHATVGLRFSLWAPAREKPLRE